MKIDSAIKSFFEKYDREAIQSIDALSKDFTLNHASKELTRFKAVNINEGFDIFDNYLKGYASHMIKSAGSPDALSVKEIREAVDKFFTNKNLFEPMEIGYKELPNLITGYVEGVDRIIKTIDEIKSDMTDAGVAVESVAEVNEISDRFVEKLNEAFYPLVESSLWASGYNAKKKLASASARPKPSKVVFV